MTATIYLQSEFVVVTCGAEGCSQVFAMQARAQHLADQLHAAEADAERARAVRHLTVEV